MSRSRKKAIFKDKGIGRKAYHRIVRRHNGTILRTKIKSNTLLDDIEMVAVAQVLLRQRIAAFTSEKLNECREEITDFKEEAFCNEVAALGLEIIRAQLIDITFPKSVQDLFSRVLESKIRATSELENARTAVATARALKNASELMKGDENIKFFQYLETITKIADKGKHTFVIGEVPSAKI